MKRILIPIFFALVFCPTSTKADDEDYLGTVLETGAANYLVQMDDGRLLNVEWDSGYDDWSRGDRSPRRPEAPIRCRGDNDLRSGPRIILHD